MIRSASLTDAKAMLRIYTEGITTTAVSFETKAPTLAEFRRRIREISRQHPWLKYEVDGKVVGYAYASTHRLRKAYQWSADVSVYVHSDFRKRRVGRELYLALFEILRKQGYYNAFAGITLSNTASIQLHESLGFERIGVYRSVGFKLGIWHDVGWWQLQLQEYKPHPKDPKPFRKLKKRP